MNNITAIALQKRRLGLKGIRVIENKSIYRYNKALLAGVLFFYKKE